MLVFYVFVCRETYKSRKLQTYNPGEEGDIKKQTEKQGNMYSSPYAAISSEFSEFFQRNYASICR
jgi:hypothetical protein